MKDFSTMKPRHVEAYLRQVILSALGDEVENRSSVNAKRGYYNIQIVLDKNRYVEFTNFRKADSPRIAKAIRALKA